MENLFAAQHSQAPLQALRWSQLPGRGKHVSWGSSEFQTEGFQNMQMLPPKTNTQPEK